MTPAKGTASKADATPVLKTGDAAPDFTLRSHAGEEFTPSAHRDHALVIAFFPAAFTGT